jgi:hypothetical protein
MLPNVDEVFTLVRRFAARSPVTDVAAPKWLVQQHGLAPLAARAGLGIFREDLVRATVEWSRIAAELPEVVQALREAGVRSAPIKGVAYAKRLYASPAERPMNDIDLLIRGGDRARAADVLRKLGFERSRVAGVLHHAAPYVRGDQVIDVHWNIIGPGRAHIDLADVWARTESGWPEGSEQLAPADALAFHLVHLARNRLRLPLINVVDAARLFELARPEAALDRARAWGLELPVKLALRFCEGVLEGRAGRPAGWLGPSRDDAVLLPEPSRPRKLVFDLVTAGSPLQLASRVAQFSANFLRRRRQ